MADATGDRIREFEILIILRDIETVYRISVLDCV